MKSNRRVTLVVLVWFLGACQSLRSEDNRRSADFSGKMELARQFVDSNQMTKAISVLQPLSKSHPESENVHYLYGLALMGMGNVRSSLHRFERSLEINDEFDDARLSLSYALIAVKKYSEAKEHLEFILDRDTYLHMERVHVNLGLNEMEQKRCKKALPHFERALQLDPTLVSAYFNKGKCLAKLGKLRSSYAAYLKASDFCPGCGAPQIELAKVQFRLGNHKEAIAGLAEVIRSARDGAMKKRAMALKSRMMKIRR